MPCDYAPGNGSEYYQYYCCYVHITYESLIDKNRYDKIGCINVNRPFEDYEGSIDNVKDRVNTVKADFENTIGKDVKVKILCSSSFLKFSAFALLAIILF